MLAAPQKNKPMNQLELRLDEINKEIELLRQQQRYIVALLQDNTLLHRIGVIDIHSFTAMMDKAGVTEEIRWRFHHEFEKAHPQRHQLFLEQLGLSEEKINEIRIWSNE